MSAFVQTAGVARASQPLWANKVLGTAVRLSRDVQRQRHVIPPLIRRYRATTWRWQALSGSTRTHRSIRPSTKAVLRFWVRAAGRAYLKAINPPHKGAWLCIHRYEGSWRGPGDPDLGGVQLDPGCQV